MSDAEDLKESKEFKDMQQSITCLAAQLPEAVYNDVAKKWDALKKKMDRPVSI